MAMQERMQGVLTPVVMPYTKNLLPDAERLLAQCRWLLSQNVGIAVFGTNSEASSLSVAEKIALLDYLVAHDIDPGRLMPGTGLCALTDSVQMSSHVARLGCGGALVLPPFYYKNVSDEGLYRFYSELIQRVGDARLQIYLYHIPPISQVPLSLSLIERLISEYPDTVVGIKDSSGDWDNTRAMLEADWDDFRVFTGNEKTLLSTLQLGGAGGISATANINPADIYALYENWQSPDAPAMQQALAEFRDFTQSFPVIPALKATIAHYRDDENWRRVRPPLVELDDTRRTELLTALQQRGFEMPGIS